MLNIIVTIYSTIGNLEEKGNFIKKYSIGPQKPKLDCNLLIHFKFEKSLRMCLGNMFF